MHVTAHNYGEYAFRAWPILCQRAAEGSVITYKELGELIGLHHRQIGRVLGVIQDYCLEAQLSPLTILIVNKNTGQPGEGFIAWDADDIPTGKAQVYIYTNWPALPNPFAYADQGVSQQLLVRRLVDEPGQAAKVYRLVQDRGVVQSIFRRVLLEVYEGKCASFCRFSFADALGAAHIVRYSKASHAGRLDPATACSSVRCITDLPSAACFNPRVFVSVGVPRECARAQGGSLALSKKPRCAACDVEQPEDR
jgi:putative restriction endonuclease